MKTTLKKCGTQRPEKFIGGGVCLFCACFMLFALCIYYVATVIMYLFSGYALHNVF